jgi:hypothetical protein
MVVQPLEIRMDTQTDLQYPEGKDILEDVVEGLAE